MSRKATRYEERMRERFNNWSSGQPRGSKHRVRSQLPDVLALREALLTRLPADINVGVGVTHSTTDQFVTVTVYKLIESTTTYQFAWVLSPSFGDPIMSFECAVYGFPSDATIGRILMLA